MNHLILIILINIMTFSINIGTNVETTSYQLTGDLGTQSTFGLLLDRLLDNQEFRVNPPDIRDSILSIWSSTIFKPTTNNLNIPYIGIDTLNPENRDLKDRKILIGKRNSGNDVMSNSLLTSDYDILFYNTKLDVNNQTKISLLSGINSNNFQNSPFIKSQISGTSSSFEFNSNSNINISSSDNILINGFKLPSGDSAFNNRIITWNSNQNSMTFDNINNQLPSDIGTSSQPLDIYGDPVNVNGFELYFSDNRKSPVEIGDIKYGNTFESISISDMLKRIIYKYLPPMVSIKILPPYQMGYAEFGLVPSVNLEFSIFKRTLSTSIATLSNMLPSTYPAIISDNYITITDTASGFITSPLNTNGINFTISVNDGTQSTSSSVNLRGIYPYFYGFLNNSVINSSNLLNLTKLIEDKSDKDIAIQTSPGFFYFIYDSLYGDISEVLDINNNLVTFEYYEQTLSSPNGFWVNKNFKIYKIDNLSQDDITFYRFKY